MPPREGPARRRGAGLVEHGCALRRRLAEMQCVKAIVLAGMADAAHARRVGKDPLLAIDDDGVIRPAPLPERVDYVHVLFRHGVAVVVRLLSAMPHPLGGGVEIPCDDIPADPTLGQVVERRHAAGEGERRFIGERDGHSEAEVLRGVRHGRDKEERIVDRRLRGVAKRRVGTPAEDIVDSEHVRQEQPVKEPALERPGKLDPGGKPPIVARAVARMPPQARRLVGDAIHLECVETDLLRHAAKLTGVIRPPSRAGALRRAWHASPTTNFGSFTSQGH